MTSNPDAFVRDNTVTMTPPLVPEIILHLAAEVVPLWRKTEEELQEMGVPPPYWAFAWAGGQALARYIRAKMEFSRRQPKASRIFAMEVISGGDCLSQYFNQNYLDWFRGRAAVFEAWIAAGKMDPVDPVHLIFLLWSSTQHYADFASQICRVKQSSRLTKQDFEQASDQLVQIILKGCGLTPAAKA